MALVCSCPNTLFAIAYLVRHSRSLALLFFSIDAVILYHLNSSWQHAENLCHYAVCQSFNLSQRFDLSCTRRNASSYRIAFRQFAFVIEQSYGELVILKAAEAVKLTFVLSLDIREAFFELIKLRWHYGYGYSSVAICVTYIHHIGVDDNCFLLHNLIMTIFPKFYPHLVHFRSCHNVSSGRLLFLGFC